jgi:hypothetical protein
MEKGPNFTYPYFAVNFKDNGPTKISRSE